MMAYGTMFAIAAAGARIAKTDPVGRSGDHRRFAAQQHL
jgi:hypothetical protein